MTEKTDKSSRDRRVLDLYEKVLEIEQRLIPTGLHVFGRPPKGSKLTDLLVMAASFDRTELGIRSLPDLVSQGLGYPGFSVLLNESARSEERLQQREEVQSITRSAVERFMNGESDAAAEYLFQTASVDRGETLRVFELLERIRSNLDRDNEMDGLLRALRGEYVEPGPGADIIQNPGVLPTGRNTHAVNPYAVPSAGAVKRAESTAAALLSRHFEESGHYPKTIAMVLWGIDNIKTEGEGVAQVLWLLGVRPKRDAMNRVSDVEVIPFEQLKRPRIDVVMTVSGIFRDLFGATLSLLDKAVRAVAMLNEPHDINYLKRNIDEQMRETNCEFDEAVIRLYSNAAGNYGTNVNFMVLDSQWEEGAELGDLFVTRKCFAYGRDSSGNNIEGRQARELLERALSRVEVTFQNIDTTEVGITDVDHYFEYLGGVSKAVEKLGDRKPAIYLSDATSPGSKIRTLEETVRLETRTKTLNPKWFEGMLRHGFSGVAEIEHHITNTFGWSATADAVDDWVYDEMAATYVLDEKMLDRMRALNPHSVQTMVSRLLEASGRGFWSAEQSVLDRLHQISANLEDTLEGVAS